MAPVIFELHKRGPDYAATVLLCRFEEECPAELIAHRANRLLWTFHLVERQNLVVVRGADSGTELYRRAIGTLYIA